MYERRVVHLSIKSEMYKRTRTYVTAGHSCCFTTDHTQQQCLLFGKAVEEDKKQAIGKC